MFSPLLLVLSSDTKCQGEKWENRHREPTLQQVRRAMGKLLPQLGTPARPPHPRGKSPGQAKGTQVRKAKRFPIVRQTPKVPPLVPI